MAKASLLWGRRRGAPRIRTGSFRRSHRSSARQDIGQRWRQGALAGAQRLASLANALRHDRVVGRSLGSWSKGHARNPIRAARTNARHNLVAEGNRRSPRGRTGMTP